MQQKGNGNFSRKNTTKKTKNKTTLHISNCITKFQQFKYV